MTTRAEWQQQFDAWFPEGASCALLFDDLDPGDWEVRMILVPRVLVPEMRQGRPVVRLLGIDETRALEWPVEVEEWPILGNGNPGRMLTGPAGQRLLMTDRLTEANRRQIAEHRGRSVYADEGV